MAESKRKSVLSFLRRAFSDNRRDGSRMVSSAVLVAFLAALRLDTRIGLLVAVSAGLLAFVWFLLYMGLEKER